MHLKLVYKKLFDSTFPGVLVKGRYIDRFMERQCSRRLYLLMGCEQLLDLFFLDNGIEVPIRTNKQNRRVCDQRLEIIFKLSRQGEELMNTAFNLNGQFSFSFYEDEQDPWAVEGKDSLSNVTIEKGLEIEIGRIYHVINCRQ